MRFDALVCDLDGVVYRGPQAIPGAPQKILALRAQDVRVVFCTNQSRLTVGQYLEVLAGLGVPTEPEDLVTSAVVTAEELAARGGAGKRAIVIGGEGVREALGSAGIAVDDDAEQTSADFVVVGLAFDADYASLRRATLAVRAGATLVATNDDPTYPHPEGFWPGAGALLAAVETATGVRAEVMGKPHRPMLEAAARRLAGAGEIALVGDSLRSDLAGAHTMGWPGVLVLSGVTTAEEASRADPKPALVIASIAELEREPGPT
jgi:HAD superfamily hydrolase (TIGR01450 family)